MLNEHLSTKEAERFIAQTADREEWWIAPAMPSATGPREWRNSEESAINDAKNLAIEYNCMYEVYKRVCIISKDN